LNNNPLEVQKLIQIDPQKIFIFKAASSFPLTSAFCDTGFGVAINWVF